MAIVVSASIRIGRKVNGTDGANGNGVVSIVDYYKTATTTPSTPTESGLSSWSSTYISYSSIYRDYNLYRVTVTTYTQSATTITDPILDSSWQSGKELASEAELTAKNNLAAQLGYTDYASMVATVESTGAITNVEGGIRTSLIDAVAIVTNGLSANQAWIGSLEVGDNFRVDNEGNMTAQNATISGQLIADGSKVGAFTIDSGGLKATIDGVDIRFGTPYSAATGINIPMSVELDGYSSSVNTYNGASFGIFPHTYGCYTYKGDVIQIGRRIVLGKDTDLSGLDGSNQALCTIEGQEFKCRVHNANGTFSIAERNWANNYSSISMTANLAEGISYIYITFPKIMAPQYAGSPKICNPIIQATVNYEKDDRAKVICCRYDTYGRVVVNQFHAADGTNVPLSNWADFYLTVSFI